MDWTSLKDSKMAFKRVGLFLKKDGAQTPLGLQTVFLIAVGLLCARAVSNHTKSLKLVFNPLLKRHL